MLASIDADQRSNLLRASALAMAASENLICARAFAGRSNHRVAQYEANARSSLEIALSILAGSAEQVAA